VTPCSQRHFLPQSYFLVFTCVNEQQACFVHKWYFLLEFTAMRRQTKNIQVPLSKSCEEALETCTFSSSFGPFHAWTFSSSLRVWWSLREKGIREKESWAGRWEKFFLLLLLSQQYRERRTLKLTASGIWTSNRMRVWAWTRERSGTAKKKDASPSSAQLSQKILVLFEL